jgi:hypothetical protein
MSYYIRVLSPASEAAEPSLLRAAAERHGGRLHVDSLSLDWREAEVLNPAGEEICLLERNSVAKGSLAAEELRQFQEEVSNSLPRTAADWLCSYLATVKTIYALQVLDGVYEGDGWEIVSAIHSVIRFNIGGIIQADGEGFWNEEGYYILWQFPDHVIGNWWVAVLQNGAWRKFEIDLANEQHRLAFQNGEVPDGVESWS